MVEEEVNMPQLNVNRAISETHEEQMNREN